MVNVLQSISAIHQLNVAHRDILARNILVLNDNQVRFIDFELSDEVHRNECADIFAGETRDLFALFEELCPAALAMTNALGQTALHIAAMNCQLHVVNLLLTENIDVNAKTTDGSTALYHASGSGCVDVVKLLLNARPDLNAQTKHGETALNEAAKKKHVDIVRMLLDAGANVNDLSNDEGMTALHWATKNGYLEITDMLLDAGAKVDVKDPSGKPCCMTL